MREKTPDIIIEHAVELWCRALKCPIHDNGDDSETGLLGYALSNINAENARKPDHKEAIERFRELLVTRLKYIRDHSGEPDPEPGHQNCYFDPYLDVDYSPCTQLSRAGELAGIDNSQFSIKSSVAMFPGYVSARFGYSGMELRHYPISDNRWLLTQCCLYGEDKDKIIAAIDAGKLDLLIEPNDTP